MFLIILRIKNDFSLDIINRFVFTVDKVTVYFLLPGYDVVYAVLHITCAKFQVVIIQVLVI